MLRRAVGGVLIWLALATAALAEKRVALILAAEDYDLIRPLSNPANDARAMEDLLENLDFEVFVETNRDLRRMRRALDDFREDAVGADVALLFFAGHGVALDGVNYLLPTDADASSPQKLMETGLPLSEAQDALKAVAPVAIVILDACRDDPFAGLAADDDSRGAGALEDDPPPEPGKVAPGLGRVGRADGVLFAFAAAPNETASDGAGENSPFTAALMRHLGTAGVELRTALTLVQQDVYDRSRGKQLPYIESGLPELVFITGQGVLPERDQLLIAMADLTPDLRAEVEGLAAERDMPLAPLYAALLSADLGDQTPEERARLLMEAALSYESFQSDLMRLRSDDPRVGELRAQAEEQLTLGAFETARALLTQAADIDASVRVSSRETYVARTLSEAATHTLNAGAALTDLRYDLAISDLTRTVALYAEIENEDLERDSKFAYADALTDLGDLHLVAGNSRAALEAFRARSAFAQKQVTADPLDVPWVRELIWSLNSVGNVLQQQGFLNEAAATYASALEFSQWQSDQLPDDPDLMRDTHVAHNKLGETRFAANDYPGALASYDKALALAETLVGLYPDSLTYNRDIAFTQERLGDVYLAMGDRTAARKAFDISLAVTEDLALYFPEDQDIRRDLSVSYERIGDMLVGDGDYDAGLESYGKALVIREELAALDPDNKPRQRDLAVTFERIGDINRLRDDIESALLAHQAALAIREALAALDPTNMEWQRDLSVSHELLGDLFFLQDDLVAALASQERNRAVRETIVLLDPENLARQRDLTIALEKAGNVKMAMGDLAGALELQDATLYLRRAIVAADPSVPHFRRDVSFSLVKLAEILTSEGRHDEAEPLLAEAVAIRSALVGASPDTVYELRDLSIVLNLHAASLLDGGRATEALTVAQRSVETANRLLQLAPDVPDHLHDRLVSLNRLGDAQAALGDNRAAAETFRAMAADGSALLDIDSFSTFWANDLAVALERMGNAQAAAGDIAGALKSHQDCLALRDWLVQQDSGNPEWYRNLSISYERVASMLAELGDMVPALEHQDMSLWIMRDLSAAHPDDPWYRIDLVRALDLQAILLRDPTEPNREALAILEEMQANGTLPQGFGYEEWIPNFRRALGLPTEF